MDEQGNKGFDVEFVGSDYVRPGISGVVAVIGWVLAVVVVLDLVMRLLA